MTAGALWLAWFTVASTIARLARRDWLAHRDDDDPAERQVVVAAASVFAVALAAAAVALAVWA